MTAQFPEIYKYMRAEMRPKRVIAAAATISFVSLCLILATGVDSGESKMSVITSGLFYAQYLVLIVYGSFCTGGSIANERQERTWDFQRLTPLSSGQLAVGKLIGSSLFAMFCAGVLFAWSAVAWLLTPYYSGHFILDNLTMLSFAFASLALGLFSSTQETGRKFGGVGRAAGIFGVILYLYSVRTVLDANSPNDPQYALGDGRAYAFYGLAMSKQTLVIFNMLAIGAWSLLGAKWRIGGEILEPTRFWRLPTFMLFLTWIFIGDVLALNSFHGSQMNPADSLMIVLIVPLMTAAILAQTRLDHLKAWLRPRAEHGFFARLNEMPSWVAGWLTAFVICLVVLGTQGLSEPVTMSLMLLFFAGRDLAFLQWYRLGESRRPEVAAVVFISLAYTIPILVLGILKLKEFNALFMPVTNAKHPMGIQVVPSLIQFAVMTAIVIARYRALVKPAK